MFVQFLAFYLFVIMYEKKAGGVLDWTISVIQEYLYIELYSLIVLTRVKHYLV